MSSRIFKSICLITALVMVVSLVFIMGSTYGYFSDVQEQHISNQLKLVAEGVDLSGESYFDSLDIEGVRITWIAEDGTVLYDNEKSADEMENHLERPEVQDAIKNGYGESSRYSATLVEKQIYCAQRLSNGSVVRISDSQSTILTLLLAFAQPICLVILILLIISFVVASNISKKIVEPINNIDLDDPVSADTYDELAPLINRLALQQRQIQRDKHELEKTEQIRQEFTSNVSHELKTPLHAISGYAELIQNGIAPDEDVRPFAKKIHDESTRMSQLVEDIINLTKLDSRVLSLESEDADLYLIAENVIDSLDEFAREKSINIDLTGDHVVLRGIPQLLHSIVYNLCDNAIKYNHEGGEVHVSLKEETGKAILEVSDNGIGIPPEHIPRIFERFYRVDKSHSKSVGGTGLGLSIVKHAAGLHNAEISIDSEDGQGTCIKVIFPR